MLGTINWRRPSLITPSRARALRVVEVVSRVAPIRLASSPCESGMEYSVVPAFDPKARAKLGHVVEDAIFHVAQAEEFDFFF